MDERLNPQWAAWIENIASNPYKARCRFCMKSFNLSNMGRQAISSHEKSVKHRKFIENKQQTAISSSFFHVVDSDKKK